MRKGAVNVHNCEEDIHHPVQESSVGGIRQTTVIKMPLL
jgi:hypothetical protein